MRFDAKTLFGLLNPKTKPVTQTDKEQYNSCVHFINKNFLKIDKTNVEVIDRNFKKLMKEIDEILYKNKEKSHECYYEIMGSKIELHIKLKSHSYVFIVQ